MVSVPGTLEKHGIAMSSTLCPFFYSRRSVAGALMLAGGNAAIQSFMATSTGAPVLAAGRAYLAVRALGAPINSALLVLQAACRGMKLATLSLHATLLSNVVNVILDPLAIFALALGLPGAASATVAGQVRTGQKLEPEQMWSCNPPQYDNMSHFR